MIYQPESDFDLLPEELKWRHVRFEPVSDMVQQTIYFAHQNRFVRQVRYDSSAFSLYEKTIAALEITAISNEHEYTYDPNGYWRLSVWHR